MSMALSHQPGVQDEIQRDCIQRRDGYRCKKCGRPQVLDVCPIIALSHGGSEEPENLVTLCESCHDEWRALEAGSVYPFKAWLRKPPLIVLLYWIDAMDAEYRNKSAAECLAILDHLCQALKTNPDYVDVDLQRRLGLLEP